MPYKNPKDKTAYMKEYQKEQRAKAGAKSLTTERQKRRDAFIASFSNWYDLVAKLPRRDRAIILGYYMEGRSLQELGEEQGVTRECVRQRRGKALRQLRKYLVQSLDI